MAEIEDLLASASSADDDDRREAWEALAHWVRGFVAHRMGPAERREADVTEVGDSVVGDFHRALRGGELRFATEAELHAYLRRCVANKLAAMVRRRMAERRGGGRAGLPIGGGTGEVDPGGPCSVGAAARAHELTERIETLLGADARLLFELRAQGASWKEVADALGIREESARQRGRRIREELRSAFESELGDA